MAIGAILAVLSCLPQDPLSERPGGEVPVQEPQDALREAIEEKRRALSELRRTREKEEAELKKELVELWEQLKGVPHGRLLGSVRGNWTLWDARLDLETAAGGEAVLDLNTLLMYQESGDVLRSIVSPIPAPDAGMLSAGLRYASARDERAGGRADILTYQVFRWHADRTLDSGLSLGGGFSFGLTRLANRGSGGDRDTALDYALELPQLGWEVNPHVRFTTGARWGLLHTSFNQDETRSLFTLSPWIALEILF